MRFDTRQMRNVLLYQGVYDRIRHVPGAIVECGVGKGRSLAILAFLAETEKKDRVVWGFDSFEGFPEVSTHDASVRNPKQGDWAGTSVQDMTIILDTAGLAGYRAKGNISLVKGFFEDTVPHYDGGPIALLHVDCDLYDSYMVVLKQLFPFVAKGGVVLFDEYGSDKWPGATKAVDEFFSTTRYTLQQEPVSGKYFVIKL